MEDMGKYLLFLRPRRFGKTLWLDTLINYYDVRRKDDFDRLFGDLAIGREPTPARNQYFILTWDFSCVTTGGDVESITKSLFNHINMTVKNFGKDYADFLPGNVEIYEDDAKRSFGELLALIRQTPYKLYLFIDEYDSFANEILAGSGKNRYRDLVGGEGLLKAVFKAIKSATSGSGLDRVFATGVTPVVMSDISSGANIFKNISLHPRFADLCGFTEQEVDTILGKVCVQCGLSDQERIKAISLMNTWYNGYCFHLKQKQKIYNPTLSLYFLDYFQDQCEYPDEILDANLAPDEDKLKYVQSVPGGQNILWELIEERSVFIPALVDKFGLSAMLDPAVQDRSFLTSFLWYSGVLTLGRDSRKNELSMEVPNLVIKRLYVEQTRLSLLSDPQIRDQGMDMARELCKRGQMAPLVSFIEERLFPIFSNRDYRLANELTIKSLFLTLLFNDALYIMESEREYRRRYPDLAMVVRPDLRDLDFLDVIIEFKYIALKDLGLSGEEVKKMDEGKLMSMNQIRETIKQGKDQVRQYASKLRPELEVIAPQFNPRLWVVVALGLERIIWKKV